MSDEFWTRLSRVRDGADQAEPGILGSELPAGWQFRFPNTLRTVYQDGTDQQPVFEPALLHFPNAYRAGDPRFPDKQLGDRWLEARRTALDLVLAAVSGSGYADDLMLRGSVLMSCWYPAAAREPGDLDFVVLDDAWEVADPRTDTFFADIAGAADRLSRESESVRIDASGAVSDDIWTYDRVPGRRLMLPWHADGLPGGWVQLDFVFGEKVHVEPGLAEIVLTPGARGAQLRVASKELSLAWKLVWLVTDAHPQGKDLYDAVLLAEDTPLRYSVARDAYEEADDPFRGIVDILDFAQLDTETGWDHFQTEYPSVEGSGEQWMSRLREAIEPTFTTLEGRPASAYELEASWLAPVIARIAAETDDRGDELQAVLLRQAPVLSTAVVITRELVGRERLSVADAIRIVLCAPGRADALRHGADGFWALQRAARSFGVELRATWPEHLADAEVAALVKKKFHHFSRKNALEVLAPLATDPNPRLSDEKVLIAVVEQSEGHLGLLQCAVARVRTAAL